MRGFHPSASSFAVVGHLAYGAEGRGVRDVVRLARRALRGERQYGGNRVVDVAVAARGASLRVEHDVALLEDRLRELREDARVAANDARAERLGKARNRDVHSELLRVRGAEVLGEALRLRVARAHRGWIEHAEVAFGNGVGRRRAVDLHRREEHHLAEARGPRELEHVASSVDNRRNRLDGPFHKSARGRLRGRVDEAGP